MTPIPSLYPGHEADGIDAGCTPGQFLGGLSLSQPRGATNVLPAAAGSYPISLLIPSGDESKMLTLDLSASYDGTEQSYDGTEQSFDPTDYNTNLNAYTLFGTQARNRTDPTTGTNHSFAASVA